MDREGSTELGANRPETYEPPGIVWEERIEVAATLASACAKTHPLDDPQCELGPPAS
jgi:hypothetical protein